MTFEPDKGWAWIVLLATVVSNCINGLVIYSGGVFNLALLETFEGQVGKVAFLVALQASLFALVGPLVSLLVSLKDCRTCHFIGGILMFIGLTLSSLVKNLGVLILTYGIITGMGSGFCYIPCLITIGYYFDRKRQYAIGMTMAATGVGMFCGSFVTQKLRDHYGIEGTFLLLGGLSANMCVAALLMRPISHEKKSKNKQYTLHIKGFRHYFVVALKSVRIVLKNRPLLILLITVVFGELSYLSTYVHEQAFLVNTNTTTEDGSVTMMTAFSISNTFGRFFTGLSTSKGGLDCSIVYTGQLAIIGTVTLLLPIYYNSYNGHLAFCVITGFNYGGIVMLETSLAFSTVSVEMYATAIGAVYLMIGVGILIGPSLTGVILANGGTYLQGFLFVGGVVLVAMMCSLLFGVLNERQAKRKESEIILQVDDEGRPLCDADTQDERKEKTIGDENLATKSLSVNCIDKLKSNLQLSAMNLSTHSLNI